MTASLRTALTPADAQDADASRILCIRHCQSTDNAAGVHSSRPPGAGLTDLGRSQAREAYEAIRAEPVTAVYTSTARRAMETAEILAAEFGLAALPDRGLLEYDIGVLEGVSGAEVGRRSQEILRRWLVEGELEVALPDGENGRAVAARFGASMTRIAQAHPRETVVVVTHVGTLTVGLISLCADLTADRVWGRPLGHGVPVTVSRGASGWSCTGWPSGRSEPS
ncbi:histidine phosphatase family protein [Nocardia lijiangensis]|uniref:histidine phosphatase family protein n=1 Tax=Nocardia lijiangensis TaxID=299618 RepID=UPI003D7124A3